MISYGALSAQAWFWLTLCSRCDFEADLRFVGYRSVCYGQKIVLNCPGCNGQIVKTVGMDLGVTCDTIESQEKKAISFPGGIPTI